MNNNLDRYKKDFGKLIAAGDGLHLAIQLECFPEKVEAELKKVYKLKTKEVLKSLVPFHDGYQAWYAESKALIKQLLPERIQDFIRLFEKPKVRKEITYENYKIEDYLQGLRITRGWEKEEVVGPSAAIPIFRQQLSILKSIKHRFESSLFDIRQLTQADLFDSELSAAIELNKNRFFRSAGVLAGVVLEKHLSEVCNTHAIKLRKLNSSIGDLNNALKEADITDTPQWRFIQHLADLRNLCSHDKKTEPSAAQVEDLISGTSKILKTLF